MDNSGGKADFGFEKVAWGEKAGRVRSVFESVAGKYDVMNDLMSFGVHRLWKQFTLSLTGLRPGQRALDVAGGTGDLARGMLRQVGKSGHVVLSDVRADALAAARAELRASGAAVTPVVADVSQPADVDRLARTAFDLGSVQLVCSNAGIMVAGRAWELSAADWERVMNVNFMATVHLVRAFVPSLIEAGQPARLLVTGSMASVTARFRGSSTREVNVSSTEATRRGMDTVGTSRGRTGRSISCCCRSTAFARCRAATRTPAFRWISRRNRLPARKRNVVARLAQAGEWIEL